jgi:aspartate racemase
MLTIGVIGGMGPQATMDFEARIHAVSQRMIPQHAGAGYPTMVVYYCRHAPVLINEDGSPVMPIQPDPGLLKAARVVGAAADFIVMTANGPHRFQSLIERESGRPVLSMIDLTVAEIQRRGLRNIGVLELGNRTMYAEPLGQLGIAVSYIPEELQEQLDAGIFALDEGREGPAAHAAAQAAVALLRGKGVEAILLACTEIPLLLGVDAGAPDLINPIQFLAEESVRRVIG